MNVAFYAPFKPLDHPDPSGDRTIGRELVAALAEQGLAVTVASRFRARWFSARPRLWFEAIAARRKALEAAAKAKARAFVTYHAYYKSPDVIGPYVARELGIPYVIFQGVYSTKQRRSLRTRLGFELNRRSLLAADLVFSNRRLDVANLRRLLPDERIAYVRPGIAPEDFAFDADARRQLRQAWGVGTRPVAVTAAMFRNDVKTESLTYLFARLGELARSGLDFFLVVAGDGETRERLVALAARELPGRHRFLGRVPREGLGAVLSAGDVFAFPGIGESLGMVYLEAQAAGLPVVALADGGVPEVVRDGHTGLLTPPGDDAAHRRALASLLGDRERRLGLSEAARAYVREVHDRSRNYGVVAGALKRLAGEG
ncbi:MAG: glycosyltransferase family 4 protein [Acidobacteriota bacterium]